MDTHDPVPDNLERDVAEGGGGNVTLHRRSTRMLSKDVVPGVHPSSTAPVAADLPHQNRHVMKSLRIADLRPAPEIQIPSALGRPKSRGH